ncbi:hypothetical protein RUM8411_01453 [Ruegeria meonggei]|uniref:Uncharacterized protein n=1 Tax=Ruegeria meonggei TaxID=1446476 RepID=A0A1X6YWK0_9RHOB|nr:hypothetical protein RUM8411_01453 [Ruegeria meonggei]
MIRLIQRTLPCFWNMNVAKEKSFVIVSHTKNGFSEDDNDWFSLAYTAFRGRVCLKLKGLAT